MLHDSSFMLHFRQLTQSNRKRQDSGRARFKSSSACKLRRMQLGNPSNRKGESYESRAHLFHAFFPRAANTLHEHCSALPVAASCIRLCVRTFNMKTQLLTATPGFGSAHRRCGAMRIALQESNTRSERTGTFTDETSSSRSIV